MNRRSLLAALGSAVPLGVAGCVTDRQRGADPSPTDPTQSPAPGGPGTPPEPDACPPVGFEDGRTVCEPRPDDDWGVTMGIDPGTLSLPREECRVTLENGGSAPLSSTADAVAFWVWRDGQWQYALQRVDEAALEPVEIPPGETREWTITANNVDRGSVRPPGSGDDETRFVFRFPPGVYAFGYRVSPGGEEPGSDGGGTTDGTGRESRTYARSFAVTGEELSLEPTDRVVETVERDGTLVVRTDTDREYDDSRRVSLVCDRRGNPGRAAHLSTFELYNPDFEVVPAPERPFVDPMLVGYLRDALAHVESSSPPSRVRVETVDTTVPPLGLTGMLSVRYDGTTWQLAAEEGWE